MSSLDGVLLKKALGSGVVRNVTNDLPIGIRLRKVSVGTVTSIEVVSATDLEIITSDGETDTYTFAAYTTVAALADAINADGIFEAVVIDALRSEGSANFFLTAGAIAVGADSNGVAIYDMVVDTSGAATMSCCLSPISPDMDLPKNHRVHLQEIFYNVDHTAAVGALTITLRKGTIETEIWSLLSVDATDTTIDFANGQGKISAGDGEELIVQDAGTVVNAANNAIQLTGVLE